MKKVIASWLCILICMLLLLPVYPTKAAARQYTYLNDNRNAQDYTSQNWTEKVYNYLLKVDGQYMRVHLKQDGTAYIEYFDAAYHFVTQKVIQPELPIAGGFYAGRDNYYLIYGQENRKESDHVEVVRIVKYDRNWKRLDAASVYGANTTIPFDAGCVRFTEADGILYVRTSHTMYKSADGLNHQTNMTIMVDEASMTIADQLTKVSSYSEKNKYNLAYVSHSFNQFVITDDENNIVVLDQGDAYPRAAQIAKLVKEKWGDDETRDIIKYSGDIGDNFTGATIGGLECSDHSYLTVGTADAQLMESDVRNYLYLSVNDKQLQNQTKMICLGKASNKKLYTTPQLVKISDNLFLVLWSEKVYDRKADDLLFDKKIHYVFVDGDGKCLGKEYEKKGYLSDCQPISVDGNVMWTTCDNNNLVFHTINQRGVYRHSKASYPDGIVRYPLKISNCRLVAKKIGRVEQLKDNVDRKKYSESFVLYGMDVNDELKYGVDYVIRGEGGMKSSVTGKKYYVRYLWVEARSEKYYGTAYFEAYEPQWGKSEFICEYPQDVSAKRVASGVEIKWQKEAYALGYYVYRKSENGSYTKIATITDVSKHSYIDKNARKDKSYSYYIKTYTTNGKKIITSKRSDIRKVE